MGRAAGGGRDYAIAVVDTNGKVRAKLDGFPSVTTVIGEAEAKGALVNWAAKMGVEGTMALAAEGLDVGSMTYTKVRAALKERGLTTDAVKDAASARGTAVHDYAEKLLLGLFDPEAIRAEAVERLEDDVVPYVEAMLSWYEAFVADGNEMEAAEATLVSLRHEFAGTADLVFAKPDGTIVVADFKTSKAIYDSHFVQGGAYAIAVEEMRARAKRPVKVEAVQVIRFGGDGRYEVQEREPDRETFLAMLALYNVRHGRKEGR